MFRTHGRVTDGDRVIVHDPVTSVAIDFAKVLILNRGSICLMSVLIAIHLGTREMEIVNVAHDPDGRITVFPASAAWSIMTNTWRN